MAVPKLEDVLAMLHAHEGELRAMHVRTLHVFGSVARGEAHEGSDIDLLVEFDRPIGLLHLVGVQQRLEDIFERRVDLVTLAGLKARIRDEVLREAVRAA